MANTANLYDTFTPHIQRHQPISRDDFREPATSSSWLAEVRLAIEEEERAIELLDTEILRAKGILSKLEEEKRVLEKQVQQRRSYVSPFRRVPEEIWEEIFRLFLAQYPFTQTSEGLAQGQFEWEWRLKFEMPFRLSQVCSRWRNIAISTPSLWSTVFFNLYWGDRKDVLELYLERSRGLSLDITLCAVRVGGRRNAKVEEQTKSDAAQLYQKIIHHMTRIRSLTTLELGSEFDFAGLAPPAEATFSRLEDLRLEDSNYPTWFAESVRLAPRLMKLDLKGVKDGWHQMIVGSSSLKTIEIRGLTSSAPLIEVVSTLPNLESLITSHRVLSINDPVSTTGKSTSLLHLSFSAVSAFSPMFHALDLPNIQTLSLEVVWRMGIDDLGVALARFPSLKSLSLLSIPAEMLLSDRLVNLLRGLPVISTFIMELNPLKSGNTTSVAKVISNFFSDLADEPTISPRLESLDINVPCITATGEMLNEFVRMLEARGGIGDGDGLKNVSLEGDRCTTSGKQKTEIIDRLRNIQATGVRCKVKYYKKHKRVGFS